LCRGSFERGAREGCREQAQQQRVSHAAITAEKPLPRDDTLEFEFQRADA
jgi:hypothetical protein